MLRDLLDVLRCPSGHDESWLVALVTRADGPCIVEADLSCPLCGSTYPVRQGIGWFAPPQAGVDAPAGAPRGTPPSSGSLDGEALAAYLGVVDGHEPVALTGHFVQLADDFNVWSSAPLLLLPEPGTEGLFSSTPVRSASAHSALVVGDRLPLGAGTVAAAAVDPWRASPMGLAEFTRVVRPGGRLLAPTDAAVPEGVALLAQDATHWVGEVRGAPRGLVTLRRRPEP